MYAREQWVQLIGIWLILLPRMLFLKKAAKKQLGTFVIKI